MLTQASFSFWMYFAVIEPVSLRREAMPITIHARPMVPSIINIWKKVERESQLLIYLKTLIA